MDLKLSNLVSFAKTQIWGYLPPFRSTLKKIYKILKFSEKSWILGYKPMVIHHYPVLKCGVCGFYFIETS